MTAKQITEKLKITRQYLSLMKKTLPLKKGRDYTETKLGERVYQSYTKEGFAKIKSNIKKLK